MNNIMFGLMTKRYFAPLFWTQFGVSFNDNLFRNALLFYIAFSCQTFKCPLPVDVLINICTLLFTLPYLLFSSIAGQLADKFDKSILISYTKFIELLLAVIIFIGFTLDNIFILSSSLFFLGTQATFFGPLKYSILPFHLKDRELISGNGLLEGGTFLAILLGTISGGLLISMPNHAGLWISGAVFIVALAGWLISLQIPRAPSEAPDLKINWNIFQETLNLIKLTCQDKKVIAATLGISWFWGFGLIYLTQSPNFVYLYLHSNAQVGTFIISVFSIGIGIGAISCTKFSPDGKLNLGLIPFAAFGIVPFALDLAWSNYHIVPEAKPILLGITDFLYYKNNWRTLIDLFFIAFFNGLFAVPLYVSVQRLAKPDQLGQIVAAGNIINTTVMILNTVIATILFAFHFSIPQVFLAFTFLQLIVAIVCYRLLTNDFLNLLSWLLGRNKS